MTRIHVFGWLLVFSAAVGCGPSGPKLVPVKGIVTLDGQPLGSKTLLFIPESTTGGLGAGATTKVDGSYELIAVVPGTVTDQIGCPAGSYKVTVNEPMFPIEENLPVQGQSDQADVAIGFPDPKAKKAAGPTIPPIYTSETTTTLRVTVPEGGGEANLELVSN